MVSKNSLHYFSFLSIAAMLLCMELPIFAVVTGGFPRCVCTCVLQRVSVCLLLLIDVLIPSKFLFIIPFLLSLFHTKSLYFKNAAQQGLPLSMNPRVL